MAKLADARKLHDLGWRVVAAPLAGKAPLGSWKAAQTEPATTPELKAAFSKDRNIFIITGAISRLAVLDCDSAEAETYWRERLGDVLDQTTRASTGRGHHYYFRLAEGEVHKGSSGDGWDLRAEAGGVVAPPSVHSSGKTYRWGQGRGPDALQDAPEELWAGEKRAAAEPGGEPASLLSHLLANRPTEEGGRNNWLTKVAGHYAVELKHQDGFEETVRGLGQEIGLEDAELEKLIKSIWGKEQAKGKDENPDKEGRAPTAAAEIVGIARSMFELVRSVEGDTYAIRREGSKIALPLRGGRSVRRELSRLFHEKTDKVPSSSALADALLLLDAEADLCTPQEIRVRVATATEGRIAVDLGDTSGQAVLIGPDGWALTHDPGVLFRRTASLTAAMPEPVRGGSLGLLRPLLNVTDSDWDLLVAIMVAACIRDLPHPVLSFAGEQGTAKTTAMRYVGTVLDPSSAPTRAMPRDIGEWVVAMSSSWVAGLDNLSRISEWQSDAICRASTGDGLPRRQLYSDDDLIVHKLRNVVLINGIDIGDLRGDLGDRLVQMILQRVTKRIDEKELDAIFARVLPEVTGALFDLLAKVLHLLPSITLAELPRMADFALIVAAVDEARGTNALATYMASRETISEQVVEGDSVAVAIRRLSARSKGWIGTATELLKELDRHESEHRFDKNWPKTPRELSARLRRLSPDLDRMGVKVDPPTNKRIKTWSVSPS